MLPVVSSSSQTASEFHLRLIWKMWFWEKADQSFKRWSWLIRTHRQYSGLERETIFASLVYQLNNIFQITKQVLSQKKFNRIGTKRKRKEKRFLTHTNYIFWCSKKNPYFVSNRWCYLSASCVVLYKSDRVPLDGVRMMTFRIKNLFWQFCGWLIQFCLSAYGPYLLSLIPLR